MSAGRLRVGRIVVVDMATAGERGGGQGSRTVPVTIEEPVLVPMSDAERAAAAAAFAEILMDWWTGHSHDDRRDS